MMDAKNSVTEKKTILVVDDEELNRAILAEIFREKYLVLEAENGREALDVLAREPSIAIVLLDVVMPVLDGFGVLAEMNRTGRIKETPVALITAESSERSAIQGYELGVSDIINKPFNPKIVLRRAENIVELFLHQHHLEKLVEDQLAILEKQAEKLRQTSHFVIDTLATVIEFRSGESGRHIRRMLRSTALILESLRKTHPEYGLTNEKIEVISNASVLHDVGKIAIPDAVLNKPGRLTAEEFEIMKSHCEKGCEILKTLDYVQDEELFSYSYEICRHHHERWDGKGYPDGMRGKEIPLCSQVVGIADAYDALTSDRVYKKAYPHETAVRMILAGECGTFNPILLECFSSVADRLPNIKERNSAVPAID